MGGIGKTQIAIQYAYLHRQDYTAICWVSAETENTIQADYLKIFDQIHPDSPQRNDPNFVIQSVKQWLTDNTNWLLVFDNVDDPNILLQFIPPQAEGHILITSRLRDMQQLGIHPLEITKMGKDEAVDFLLQRTGRSKEHPDDLACAQELAKELDYLPLALEQAAAYMVSLSVSFQDYLEEYRSTEEKIKLLEKSKPILGNYPASVLTTWDISFNKVKAESQAAVDVLNFIAFLSADEIPLSLIESGAFYLGEEIQKVLKEKSKLTFNKLLRPLTRFSLVEYNEKKHTLSIHRLVQEVYLAKMEEKVKNEWINNAINILLDTIPSNPYETWTQCNQLIPHYQTLATQVLKWELESEKAGLLLNQVGYLLDERGQYKQAEPLYRRALEIREQALGPLHPDTAASLNNLAALYDNQGKYEQAEPLYRRALEIDEKVLGSHHPDTATDLNNLAALYRAQGKYEQAEPLYRRALEIVEQALGPLHPSTATFLNNLAELYRAQGKYEQAEPLYRRALEIDEKVLGSHHPGTAMDLNNLAGLYRAQGKYEQAEPLFRRALEIKEQALGPLHPSTAASLNNLAELYRAQGKYEQAEPLFRRALEIAEQALGPRHPHTATSLNNLALLYDNQGQYEQAEPLFRRALEINEKALGAEHPSTVTISKNYESCLEEMKKKKV